MAPKVHIIFDAHYGIFFAGQTITGRVEVICDKAITCKGITVTFSGDAHVKWEEESEVTYETEADGQQVATVIYENNESYYNKEYRVWGDGCSKSELPAGSHIFNFSFLLPSTIPTSLETKYGYVRHVCRVKLHQPWKKNTKLSRPYSVIDLYDLNQDPKAKVPLLLQESKTLCCLCCTSGPISLLVNINKSGFVPGENIVINAECCNKSRWKIKKTKASVHQTITHHASSNTKDVTRELCTLVHGEIPAGQDHMWTNVLLPLPTVPSSHLKGCSIINISYEFRFEMEPTGSRNLIGKAPIIIGTIPLQQSFGQFVPEQTFNNASAPLYDPNLQYASGGMASTTNCGVFPPMNQYPNLPPPSYSSCVFGDTGTKGYDSDDSSSAVNKGWSPQYISYKQEDRGHKVEGTRENLDNILEKKCEVPNDCL